MKLNGRLRRGGGSARIALVLASVTSMVGMGLSVSPVGAAPKKTPLVVGGIFPFTGSKSLLSQWGTQGLAVGIYEVNHNGGVLGHQLKSSLVDDAADSVDALPAFRKLMLSHPTFVIGPFSPTIEAVINQFKPSNVADFMIGGISNLDTMHYPYVFRTTASDSAEAIAMAYYAISHGWKTASLMFDNSANSQGYVAPLMKAFKALGGTIQQNIMLTPSQSSYSTELTQAFAGKPAVVFNSMDSQTFATLVSDAQQLGYTTQAKWVGDDAAAAPHGVYAKAFGPAASTNLIGAVSATPTTADNAYNHFLADYQSVYRTTSIQPLTSNIYDAVVIASLAMTMAKSTNPKKWIGDVMKVSDPPGIVCSTYAQCVALIKHGKKVNYNGAGGNEDFNKFHNVFSGFQMVGFDSNLNNVVRSYVTAQQLATVVAKEK
jgi:ABC-type branched-subunit amino acid transport system substrate-binding protein